MKLVLNGYEYPILDIKFATNNFNVPVDILVSFDLKENTEKFAHLYEGTIIDDYSAFFGHLPIEGIIHEPHIDGDTLPNNIYELINVLCEGPKYPKI